MANVLFITEDYLKQFTIINDNVEMKLITPIIDKIQDQRILPMIGTGLYNELRSQIVANTVTALNTTLLDDYINKAILWWVMFESPLIFTYRFMNKGVMKKSSDNSSPADLDELQTLRLNFKNDAEWYTQRMILYLIENSSSYPLYDNPGNGIDTITPQGYSYSAGMNLEPESYAELKNLRIDFGRLYNC
jgi:hypothetical protein